MRVRILTITSFAILLLILMSAAVPTSAQTATATPNADCKPADLLKTFASLKTLGNPQKDMDTLLKAEQQIKDQDAACNGFSFKGTGSKSIGPFQLDSGTYLVHLVTDGFFIANFKLLSGDCKASGALGLSSEMTGGLVYSVMQNQATDGADITIDSNDCKAIITTTNVTAPWKVTISKIS